MTFPEVGMKVDILAMYITNILKPVLLGDRTTNINRADSTALFLEVAVLVTFGP